MKNSKWLMTIILILNIAIAVVIMVFLSKKDKQAPVISFSSNEITYTPGMEQDALYDGIFAEDDVDGDVTDRIVIEKITENEEQDKVTISYAVSDKSGNVAKASRAFPADYSDNNTDMVDEENTDSEQEENSTVSDAKSNADTDTLAENAADSTGTPVDTDSMYQEIEDEIKEELKDEIKKELEDEIKAEIAEQVSQAYASQTTAESTQTAAAPAASNAKASEKPSILLGSTTIKTSVGQAPAWTNIITGLHDDKDDYGTLFKTLKYDKVDFNQKGNHTVQLRVTDSDGNVSDPVTVTVVVQ